MTTKFDTKVVNAVLKGIVNETKPGTRYVDPDGRVAGQGAQCVYTDRKGKGSCLVGRVMERLSVPLPGWNEYGNSNGVGHLDAAVESFTPEALSRLRTVQGRQDSGETWKRAIR